MEENREIEIDLRKIFEMLKKKIVYILLIGIIGAILAACYTNFFIDSKYTATVKLYAYSSNDYMLSPENSISVSQFDASEKIIKTYLEVIKSYAFLEKVADKFDNTISAGQIKGMMSCAQIEGTLAFQISVSSTNAQTAMDVANAIADTCPDEIVRILKVGGVSILDNARKPTAPSYPDTKKNVLIGFAAAFAVSLVFFFLKEIFDTSIKDEKDLEREFDIPILGSIPRLIPTNDNSKEGGASAPSDTVSDGMSLTISEKEDK
ncbi:MAG: hypothetical protein J1E81_08560 [Eubacterium sp.]|nr:hypothetical protein [Eubacterium sp.]